MKKIYFALLALTVLFSGCGKSGIPSDFDYGKVENGIYKNGYFNMSMDIPEDWHSHSQEEINDFQQIGREMRLGENAERVVKAAELNSANLLFITKRDDYTDMDYGLSLAVENIKMHPSVKDGKRYIIESSQLLEQLNMPYESFDGEITEHTIGGKKFYMRSYRMTIPGYEFYQDNYATVDNGFVLLFSTNYQDEQQRNELLDILSTVKFN